MSGGGSGLETVPIMEALLLNCAAGLNLTLILNNIWTWLAVMTAAVGFWRIRSLKPDLGPDQAIHAEKSCCPVQPVQDQTAVEPDQTPSTSTRPDDELAYENEIVTSPTKGNRYRACYNYCMHEDEDEEEVVVEERENGGGSVVVEEWRRESAAVAVAGSRREETGWYRYQDRRVLDGSVVRLWDHYCSSNSTTKTTTLVTLTRYVPSGL